MSGEILELWYQTEEEHGQVLCEELLASGGECVVLNYALEQVTNWFIHLQCRMDSKRDDYGLEDYMQDCVDLINQYGKWFEKEGQATFKIRKD